MYFRHQFESPMRVALKTQSFPQSNKFTFADISYRTSIERRQPFGMGAMARFKVPQRVATVDTFPVVESANSNKIQRTRLQQMAKELLATEPQE